MTNNTHRHPRASTRRQLLATVGTTAAIASAGCIDFTSNDRVDDEAFVIVARDFTEHQLLSYMTQFVLTETETKNARVVHREWESFKPYAYLPYEPLDFHWEYMGTANEAIFLDIDVFADGIDAGIDRLREEALPDGIQILEPTGFRSAWELVAAREWVEETGIETYSQVTERYNERQDLTVALKQPFAFRGNAWPALLQHYVDRVQVDPFENVILVGPLETYDTVFDGRAQVGEGATSEPQITENHVILEDDREFYIPSPVLPFVDSNELTTDLEQWVGELAVALDSAETMRELNARVDFDGEDIETVAREFVISNVL